VGREVLEGINPTILLEAYPKGSFLLKNLPFGLNRPALKSQKMLKLSLKSNKN